MGRALAVMWCGSAAGAQDGSEKTRDETEPNHGHIDVPSTLGRTEMRVPLPLNPPMGSDQTGGDV